MISPLLPGIAARPELRINTDIFQRVSARFQLSAWIIEWSVSSLLFERGQAEGGHEAISSKVVSRRALSRCSGPTGFFEFIRPLCIRRS